MPNELHPYPDGPPTDIWIWWDKDARRWRVWFGESPPMIDGPDYSPFNDKMFHYKNHGCS